MIERIFKIREWLAGLPALISLIFVILGAQTIKVLESKPAAPQIMQLSMVSLPEPPKPIEPPPEPIEPPTPEPVEPPPVTPAPPVLPEPDTAAPVVEIKKPTPPEPPKPVEHKKIVEHKAPPKPVAKPEPKPEAKEPPAKAEPAPVAPPKPPVAEQVAPKPIAPEPKPNLSAAAEASYIAKVRADLEANKRYPTGREASLTQPSGTVRIWMTLNRQGEVVDSGIEQTSHAMLLDRTALSTVRRSNFAPFPADSWPGAATHRFTVDLNYQPTQ